MKCPVVGFGLSMGSVCLWAVIMALIVLDKFISTATLQWRSQHIFTATSPLLVPEIIALASVPWSILHC